MIKDSTSEPIIEELNDPYGKDCYAFILKRWPLDMRVNCGICSFTGILDKDQTHCPSCGQYITIISKREDAIYGK